MTSKTFHPFIVSQTIVLILFAGLPGCKKDGGAEAPPPPSSSVIISGTSYPTVMIGGQEWTSSNYNGPGGSRYNDNGAKPEYGKYYSYEEVKAISIPAGWRIPTMDDYIKLCESQGVVVTNYQAVKQHAIKKLTSTTNWLHIPGNNQSGFNAHPGGYIFQTGQPMDGDISEFWTATGHTFSIQEGVGEFQRITFYDNSNSSLYKFNLRFVRDR